LHAVAIARELHIPTVILPRFPAHFSALGMLMADERHDFTRTFYSDLQDADFARLRKIYAEMVEESKRLLTQGIAVTHQLLLDLRYVGQEFTLPVPVSLTQLAAADPALIRSTFDALHEQRYAHHSSLERVEIINVRLVALGHRAKLALPHLAKGGSVAHREMRLVHFDQHDAEVECPVYSRDELPPGAEFTGPALVSEYGSTTVLFPGDDLTVAATGELTISLRKES
jgi:N-methylhydantoinase A